MVNLSLEYFIFPKYRDSLYNPCFLLPLYAFLFLRISSRSRPRPTVPPCTYARYSQIEWTTNKKLRHSKNRTRKLLLPNLASVVYVGTGSLFCKYARLICSCVRLPTSSAGVRKKAEISLPACTTASSHNYRS